MYEVGSANTRPRPGGGLIRNYDPTSAGFKQALITIVFVGVWLEAATHLALVHRFGLDKAAEHERLTYVPKLRLLGITDQAALDRAERLRNARNELVHEKAFLNSKSIRVAQDEADNAYELLVALCDEWATKR